MTFQEMLPTQQTRIWVAPVDRAASDPKTWIPVTSGEWWDDKPRWSPAGSLLYFMSHRDGFRCIWVSGWTRRRDGRRMHRLPLPIFTTAGFLR